MEDGEGIGGEFDGVEPSRTRDAKGRVLPGVVLNPRGRPPVIRDIRDAAKAHTRGALATLVNIMDDTEAPASARIAAAIAILDRGHGKPQQNVETRLEVTHPADAAAKVLIELSARAKARKAEEGRIIDVTPNAQPN